MIKTLACCMLLWCTIGAADPAAAPKATRPDPARIARGRAAFGKSCALCHGANLAGGGAPALVGASFQNRWLSNAGGLDPLDAAVRRMPKQAPGSLTAATYVDILEYIVAANHAQPAAAARPGPRILLDLPAPPRSVSAASTAVPTEPELLQPRDGDWSSYNRDLQGQRFSRLAQINRDNA